MAAPARSMTTASTMQAKRIATTISRISGRGRVDVAAVLLALSVGCGSPGTPPMHDHRPRHGGVVTMAGDVHIEAVARLDGLVRIYLTDLRRNPIAPGDVTASATLSLADGRVALPLVPAEDALEARGPELRAGDLPLRVDVRRGGHDAV